MAAANNADSRFEEWFRLSNSEYDDGTINQLILVILRDLNAAFPERVNLLDYKKVMKHIDDFRQFWGWLDSQDMVSGPLSNSSLTLQGRQSFRAALVREPDLAAVLLHAEDGLEGHEANQMMLAVLREHFFAYIERKEER